jgi:2-polyprenyl-3-methyl-5-hydroxy-6-metoxy-1,4-benzoquinol methylase
MNWLPPDATWRLQANFMNDQRYSTAAGGPAGPAAGGPAPLFDVRRPVGRYQDGAEAELAAIMAGATDRSSSSDELRAAIHDWPTKYHLSPMRANLLRPLRLGHRLLEVGAGTGVLTRWLAEQGHDVLAVEGSLARAEVAAARCAGLAGAQVACGGAGEVDADADGPFDAVLLIGVLEYAGVGGLPGADELLASCAGLLGPSGVVVVAIEN